MDADVRSETAIRIFERRSTGLSRMDGGVGGRATKRGTLFFLRPPLLNSGGAAVPTQDGGAVKGMEGPRARRRSLPAGPAARPLGKKERAAAKPR
jgi:hypothetical protein